MSTAHKAPGACFSSEIPGSKFTRPWRRHFTSGAIAVGSRSRDPSNRMNCIFADSRPILFGREIRYAPYCVALSRAHLALLTVTDSRSDWKRKPLKDFETGFATSSGGGAHRNFPKLKVNSNSLISYCATLENSKRAGSIGKRLFARVQVGCLLKVQLNTVK